ncbi:hybrid sensor histidine kinase/response regulator [bacterium]|nr:hybrid sensor histidine kinase/response regulator [bacterium]
MDEILNEFLVECSENIERLENGLVELEKKPDNLDVLKIIFRAMHTIKGTCGMFGLGRMEKISHVAEDVLAKLRDGAIPVTAQAISAILVAIDIVKHIAECLERTGEEPTGDDSVAIQNLKSVLDTDNIISREENTTAITDTTSQNTPQQESKPVASIAQSETTPKMETKAPASDQSLRVNIGILDQLMNLVGELVLNRNQLLQLVRGEDESPYLNPIQQLNRVTSGLQEAVMKTRMQPIGNAWSKLPRIVRDLEQATGKKLELVMIGQETEIDRQILQAIQDPLTHCVRNSADHGIEKPDKRATSGKSPVGKITLKAFHEGGHIIIAIEDDGGGINPDIIKAKAIEKGLVSKEIANNLSDTQILRYIFEPGFSTAAKVTEVSGRGVGMDVVRSNIESIGGSVDISSTVGVGTCIKIKIPLTLAIISALIVRAGDGKGNIFAIPQVGVLELVHISETNRHFVDTIQGAKVLRLRGKLLPLITLSEVLGLKKENEINVEHDLLSIVVVQVADMQFGLIVDEIYDTQEIVVKPVGRLLREVNLFSGSTILGDGRVVIILDIARISAQALPQVISDAAQAGLDTAKEMGTSDKTSLLVFKSDSQSHFAVPLALVARLEEFETSKIEKVGNQLVVQYRNSLLPLIKASDKLNIEKFTDLPITAIIFTDGERGMGLLVEEIVDIVDEHLKLDTSGIRPGFLGGSIIAGRATELIDVYHFLRIAYPDWFKLKSETKNEKSRILFVDDSAFFRNLLRPILESRGFDVTTAEDGAEALKILKKDSGFDLLLSDIEMPNMDGFGLISNIRSNDNLKNLPALALTTLAAPPSREKGMQLGFTDYLIKFDQDMVLEAISKTLKQNNAGGQA